MTSPNYLTHLLHTYHTDLGMGDASVLYLGNSAVEHYTEWFFKGGNTYILAVNPHGSQVDHAVKEAAALAEAADQAQRSGEDRESEETDPPTAVPSGGHPPGPEEHEVTQKWDGPVPATLVGIFAIDSEHFFATSDAYFKGPTKFTPSLSRVKLTCQLVPTSIADHAVMHEDSVNCLEEVGTLIDLAPTMKGRPITGAYNTLNNSLKVGHQLFEPLERDPHTGAVIPDPPRPAGEEDFTIEGYPVQSKAAREELKALASTHRLVPLPAYGIDGHLINPHMYRESLVGALVEARFVLRENYIEKKNVFSADLVALNVIAPPPTSTNPLKRKRIPTVFDDCPAKRAARFYDTPGSGPSRTSGADGKACKN